MTDPTEQILQTLHTRLAHLERQTHLGVFNGPNDPHASEPISGVDEDVFDVVVSLSDVNTLSRLSQISKALLNLVESRTHQIARFLEDMHDAVAHNRELTLDRERMHGRLTYTVGELKPIFSDLPILSRSPLRHEYAWTTTIGCWDLWVYLDKEDYLCVTAMKLRSDPGIRQHHAHFCVLHFPRGNITSYDQLYRVLLSKDFNAIRADRNVFSIHPYEIDFFQRMSMRADDIDLTDLQGKSAEVLKMHKWLRSNHMLRTDQFNSPIKMKIYKWRWIPDRSAYLVTFRYFSNVRNKVSLVYAYIKCMENTPNIDSVWIFTTRNVPLEHIIDFGPNPPVVGNLDIRDVWAKTPQNPNEEIVVSITTRYNVGHYHNLVSLLCDYNWGMRETHDITDKLKRSFNEDGTLNPPLHGYNDDGWPLYNEDGTLNPPPRG